MAKTCNGCGESKTPSTIPYSVWEDFKKMHNSTVKKFWITVLILIFLLVGTNVGWLIYESQFETVESTVEEYKIDQNAESGNNNSIINGGEIVNGEADDTV